MSFPQRIFILFPGLLLHFYVMAREYQFELSWKEPASHIYLVKLATEPVPGKVSRFQIPAWRPGRYYLQDYAAAVSGFRARGMETNESLAWKKTDKDTWEVENPASGKIEIEYSFYANVMDAGSSVLNGEMAYFNGSNLFMHLENRYDLPCRLTVPSMPGLWKSGTALEKTKQHNVFTARDYHEFIDSPTMLSADLKTLETKIEGVQYYFHFQGNFSGGRAVELKLLENVEKIIREQSAIFGEVPLKQYHFLYILLPYNSRHAVEHSYSSCYTLPETVFNGTESLGGMYGITSHEFWHLWNVKRIRPAALWPYDYQREMYTTLHWFTEGVTDYYTNLILLRAGLIAEEQFISILQNNIAQLENDYSSKIVSPSSASFESWVSQSEYGNPNASSSYYPLGSRIGLILDLAIRSKTNGEKSLDDVFRWLYRNFYQKGLGVPEYGIRQAVAEVTGQDFTGFFSAYVDGTETIPYNDFFTPFGLKISSEARKGLSLEIIGIRSWEKTSRGFYLREVHPESEAANAGIGQGQFLISIDRQAAGEISLGEFFGEKKSGDTLQLEISGNGSSQTIVIAVEISGETAPRDYEIVMRKRGDDESEALYRGWIDAKSSEK